MVRLEKVLYEQLVNTRTFKRERIISAPSKWYSEPRVPSLTLAAMRLYTQGITGQLFKLVEPFFARFVYNWTRDHALQRGLALEDVLVFQDRELRRDPLYEHIIREGFHPYQWIMFQKRRARYYKVERGVRGSYAPEWAQEEARQRTLADAAELKYEWEDYIYKNYMSDMTPTARTSNLQKILPLEYFLLYGLFRPESWDRFFYNETFYPGMQSTKQELSNIPRPFADCNLASEEGRRKFEAQVKRFIELYPGAVVREGESFNFERFYALDAIKNGRDLSKFDTQLIQELKDSLTQKLEQKSSKGKKQRFQIPSWLKGNPGKGLFA